jgi:hypothetical protein
MGAVTGFPSVHVGHGRATAAAGIDSGAIPRSDACTAIGTKGDPELPSLITIKDALQIQFTGA